MADKERVRRLLALPGVRPHSLERLLAARVAVVGMGGLGCAAALYLAGQGVGHLTLIDPDRVAAHNLGRQVLYAPEDVGRLKVEAAGSALRRLRPELSLSLWPHALGPENADFLLAGHDLVLDGLDQGVPRDLLNRWAVAHGVPVVFAGAIGYEAQVLVVAGGQPCLFCLFGSVADAAQDCAVEGVLGPVVGMAGMVQAQEALKLLLGVGRPLIGRLWTWDAYAGRTRILAVPPRPDCPVCASGPVAVGQARMGGQHRG
ncbi:MAG: HesA/MoeB/ThiF family protein [Firmicutes bacterium]|nr:HesA/MoeB/ThiF family protein [Alicyclobacillaceae bacterium]MCL6496189.1 HesA/MoeB/ThiF family protein [Bacillota bacterium]